MEDEKKKNVPKGLKKDLEPVLKKHVALIHCENKLSFLQRKISNILLFNALGGIESTEIHQIPLKQLCSLIGYRSNDIELIKQSIKGLISTVMEWNLLDDSKFINEANYSKEAISWNASSYLAGASIQKGVVHYSYSPQIKTVLFSLEIYGRINLFVQAKFNSSYSLILYENCVRFKNIAKTAWFKLDLFRSLMGLMDGKYESFKELNRNVIAVAVNEINQKSDIQIEPEYKKMGRSVVAIRFLITENESYKPTFKKLAKITQPSDMNELNQSSLIEVLFSEFNIQEKQAKEILSSYNFDYISEKINLVRNSKKAEKPAAYLVSALKNDYKENQKNSNGEQKSGGVKNTYLRETGEESQIRSLKKKYIKYKFDTYMKYLSEHGSVEATQEEFIASLINKNPIIGKMYKKNGIQSQSAMIEFMGYVDQNYPKYKVNFLDFDNYLTEEEVV